MDDFGLDAYRAIQAELGQWGEASPAASTPRRYSPGGSPATPATARRRIHDDDGGMDEGDAFSPASLRSPEFGSARRGGPVGVQTPEPAGGHAASPEEDDNDIAIEDRDDEEDFSEAAEQLIGDGTDSFRPYHDALMTYLHGRRRLEEAVEMAHETSVMHVDGEDSMVAEQEEERAGARAALDEAEMKFLSSLASVCLSRGQSGAAGGVLDDDDASKNEGNFWDLLSSLRAGGLSSLFYCVDGEEVPDLTLSNEPTAMVESAPAEVLDACLGGEGRDASLPLQRLNAALGWIEACHGRRCDEALTSDYEGSGDPLLPPPRRRTMWPRTIAALQQKGRNSATAEAISPDAPYKAALSSRTSSPVGVNLDPEDEVDDARLLRACFMLFQAGRVDQAMELVSDCGQPFRAATWTGGEPLSADGTGNPTRGLWKDRCRKISEKMSRMVNADSSSMVDGTGMRGLYPAMAYESAIMSLLSDNVDTALNNPVFQTWEDGVHAILRSELGLIEDDVLRSHNSARVEAAQASGGYFPYPGTEFDTGADGSNTLQGNDGDLGSALQKLETSPVDRIREEGSDPFRNGMTSFLVGQGALKDYIEECAVISLETENEDDACFLRFITHLILYVDTSNHEFCSQLALPSGIDAATDGSIFSLRELLLLKYVAYLSSRRELWSHVALYASLLSEDNILDTFSSFLIRVHSDRERRMTLEQARDFFPRGMDCYILRNVVRGMISADGDVWVREPGEEATPPGVAPADARMMRSVRWLCYYPEHMPDALVCANMLLRKFLLSSVDSGASDLDLYAPKVFIEKILPRDLINVAVEQCQKEDEEIAGAISLPLMQNLEAEHLSMNCLLKAHTEYTQFLDGISKTSPCHKSNRVVSGARSKQEMEIADKMERNAFRQKKAELCRMIVKSASNVSDALFAVLNFGGGWLIDDDNLDPEEAESEEAKARSAEMKAIRSAYVPRAVFMLHEVLDKTAAWLEQVAHDTLAQFGDAGKDVLLALFGGFDERQLSNDDLSADLLTVSRAAPGYWNKRALSLASVVANDANGLHETFDNVEMERFLKLMAESHIKLQQSMALFDY